MSSLPVVMGSLGGWQITGIVIAGLVVLVLLITAKDIIRYIKISNM